MNIKDPIGWVTAYLGLGANLGNREANICKALRSLDNLPTIQVTNVSSFYETPAVGITDQPDFLNAAAAIETTLTSDHLLEASLAVEKNMGRVRTQRWGPRVIDIDILVYGDEQKITPTLTLPHPRLLERVFALAPLAEIAPELVLPGQYDPVKKKAEQMLENANILSIRGVINI
jgi:2-amino-4-hydroxy-6-hydroxymethyldihydropteridine diphosphokinase